MSTSATIASLSMAMLGTLLYHVFQKEIPANANPALALIVMYATGLSVINAAGVVASLVGLVLINWKSA